MIYTQKAEAQGFKAMYDVRYNQLLWKREKLAGTREAWAQECPFPFQGFSEPKMAQLAQIAQMTQLAQMSQMMTKMTKITQPWTNAVISLFKKKKKTFIIY